MVNMQEAIATARQRRPFTILGALIALVTIGAFLFLASQRSGGTPAVTIGSGGDVSVVVARSDIKARATLTPEMLDVTKLKAADVAPGVFAKVGDVISTKTQRVALIDIRAGQPVLPNMLTTSTNEPIPESSYLPIPVGAVAMTIPTGELRGVGGYIQPGDYIGIIAILQGRGTTVSKTIFNNVHVIRTGSAQAAPAGSKNTPAPSVGVTSSLTIVMSECDAEYLNWFIAKATLKYTLENYQDYAKSSAPQDSACTIDKAQGITDADVAKRFGASLVAAGGGAGG